MASGSQSSWQEGTTTEEQQQPSQRLKYGVNIGAQKVSRCAKVCRVPDCTTGDLSNGPRYCMRHRICEYHVRCQRVMFDDVPYRFCQKCTRFHHEDEFEAGKHTCREGLLLQRKQRLLRSLNARTAAQAQDTLSTSYTLDMKLPQFNDKVGDDTLGMSSISSFLDEKPATHQVASPQRQPISAVESPPVVLGVTMHRAEEGEPTSFTWEQSEVCEMDITSDRSPEIPAEHELPQFQQCADQASISAQAFDPSHPLLPGPSPQVTAPLTDLSTEQEAHRSLVLNLKFSNSTPSELPVNLRHSIMSWFAQAPSWLATYIQPGCVELTVVALLPAHQYSDLEGRGVRGLVQIFLDSPEARFFKNADWKAEAFGQRVEVQQGEVTLDHAYFPADTLREGSLRIDSMFISSAAPSTASLAGSFPPDTRVACFQDGKRCLLTKVRHTRGTTPDAPGGRIGFTISDPLPSGVLLLEVKAGQTKSCVPVLVCPDQKVVNELREFESKFAHDAPRVLGLLTDVAVALDSTSAGVVRPALYDKLLRLCVHMRWPALAGQLLAKLAERSLVDRHLVLQNLLGTGTLDKCQQLQSDATRLVSFPVHGRSILEAAVCFVKELLRINTERGISVPDLNIHAAINSIRLVQEAAAHELSLEDNLTLYDAPTLTLADSILRGLLQRELAYSVANSPSGHLNGPVELCAVLAASSCPPSECSSSPGRFVKGTQRSQHYSALVSVKDLVLWVFNLLILVVLSLPLVYPRLSSRSLARMSPGSASGQLVQHFDHSVAASSSALLTALFRWLPRALYIFCSAGAPSA